MHRSKSSVAAQLKPLPTLNNQPGSCENGNTLEPQSYGKTLKTNTKK